MQAVCGDNYFTTITTSVSNIIFNLLCCLNKANTLIESAMHCYFRQQILVNKARVNN